MYVWLLLVTLAAALSAWWVWIRSKGSFERHLRLILLVEAGRQLVVAAVRFFSQKADGD